MCEAFLPTLTTLTTYHLPPTFNPRHRPRLLLLLRPLQQGLVRLQALDHLGGQRARGLLVRKTAPAQRGHRTRDQRGVDGGRPAQRENIRNNVLTKCI